MRDFHIWKFGSSFYVTLRSTMTIIYIFLITCYECLKKYLKGGVDVKCFVFMAHNYGYEGNDHCTKKQVTLPLRGLCVSFCNADLTPIPQKAMHRRYFCFCLNNSYIGMFINIAERCCISYF